MADNNESVNLNDTETESMIVSGVNAKSTPIISKVSLDDLFQLMKVQSNELNAKFDEQNIKFDEVKNEIKRQTGYFDKQYDEVLSLIHILVRDILRERERGIVIRERER